MGRESSTSPPRGHVVCCTWLKNECLYTFLWWLGIVWRTMKNPNVIFVLFYLWRTMKRSILSLCITMSPQWTWMRGRWSMQSFGRWVSTIMQVSLIATFCKEFVNGGVSTWRSNWMLVFSWLFPICAKTDNSIPNRLGWFQWDKWYGCQEHGIHVENMMNPHAFIVIDI